jgi:hypothetical protein
MTMALHYNELPARRIVTCRDSSGSNLNRIGANSDDEQSGVYRAITGSSFQSAVMRSDLIQSTIETSPGRLDSQSTSALFGFLSQLGNRDGRVLAGHVRAARGLLYRLRLELPALSDPIAMLTPDGYVHLSWSRPKKVVSVDFTSERTCDWFWRNRADGAYGGEEEVALDRAIPQLVAKLAEFLDEECPRATR